MAPNAIDAKAAERCAANADAKQKGNEAASLPRSSDRRRPVAFPAEGDTRNADRLRRLGPARARAH
jgi:hypothetical protein